MTTNIQIKLIYFNNLINYVKQMSIYSSRHLAKLLQVTFDIGLDNSNISFNFEERHELCLASLDLIESIIQTNWMRIHAHSKTVITFLLKLLYFVCLDDENNAEKLSNLLTIRISSI